MTKTITISNSTGQYFELAYRMPGEKDQILTIPVIAFALNAKVDFPNENYYNEFKKQNGHYFNGPAPVLKEGKVLVAVLKKINEKINEEIRTKIDQEIKKTDDAIVSVAGEHTHKDLEITVEKVENKNAGRRASNRKNKK